MAKAPAKRTRKTVAADETPETKVTAKAKTAAAEKQFAKADAAGEPTTEELNARKAALGW